ncbi:MAG: hypothetical protein ACP5IC_02195 [Minisyncoccia bacterium]
MQSFIHNIINFIINLPWEVIIFYTRIIFIVFDIILLFLFIYAFINSLKFMPKFKIRIKKIQKVSHLDKIIFQNTLDDIYKKVENKSLENLQASLILLDGLLRDVLMSLGIKGEHLSDQMMLVSNLDLRTEKELMQGFKLRNELQLNSLELDLIQKQLKDIIELYSAFFKEVKLLDDKKQ